MGWGATAETRASILGDGALELCSSPPDADVVLVDAPAWYRRLCAGQCPPERVVSIVMEHIGECLRAPGGLVGVYFDDCTRMPTVRHGLWAKRYSKPPKRVATDDEIDAVTPSSLGSASWETLFASTRGKRRMFDMLFDLTKLGLKRAQGFGARCFVSRPGAPERDSAAWAYPFDDTVSALAEAHAAQRYGEAECMVVMGAWHMIKTAINGGRPPPRITVFTIDTDIALQMTPIYAAGVRVVWARVWQDATGAQFRARKKAPASATAMWEVLRCDRLVRGRSRSEQVWRLFCWLAVGGVDYCSGLGGFGWSAAALQATLFRAAPAVRYARDGSETIVVDLPALASLLASCRSSRRRETADKGGGAAALAAELDRMLFCVRYYCWQDQTRPGAAGPQEEALVPEAGDTVTGWLAAASSGGATLELPETHPAVVTVEAPAGGVADGVRAYISQ